MQRHAIDDWKGGKLVDLFTILHMYTHRCTQSRVVILNNDRSFQEAKVIISRKLNDVFFIIGTTYRVSDTTYMYGNKFDDMLTDLHINYLFSLTF